MYTRTNPDTCGRAKLKPIPIRYVWTLEILNPHKKIADSENLDKRGRDQSGPRRICSL